MKNVHFRPYVGSLYGEGINGKRVLIVVESHHGRQDCDEQFTERVILSIRKGCKGNWSRFFTKIARAVAEVKDEKQFWNRVSLHTFLQYAPGIPRALIPKEAWRASKDAFVKVLEELKPELILVFGKGLRAYLPEVPDGIRVVFSQHPSSPTFNYKSIRPRIADAFGLMVLERC